MKRLVVEMDDALHTAIKIEALQQGKSARELVTELLGKEIRKEEQDAGSGRN